MKYTDFGCSLAVMRLAIIGVPMPVLVGNAVVGILEASTAKKPPTASQKQGFIRLELSD